MPSTALSRNADIPDDATDSSTGHQHAPTLCPDLVELAKEFLVVFKVTQLTGRMLVFFQSPVGRGAYNEMYGLVGNPRQIARISLIQLVMCFVVGSGPRTPPQKAIRAPQRTETFRRVVCFHSIQHLPPIPLSIAQYKGLEVLIQTWRS